MKTILSGLLVCLLLSQGFGQSQNLEAKLDALMASQTDDSKPGAAIAILKNGKPFLVKTYGLANLEHRVPFSKSTVADIGSVAKQFTSFAICLLAEEGKLNLDDPISKHLDRVPEAAQDITIRHLANHTSGIREVYAILQLQGNRSGDGIQQIDAQNQLAMAKALNFAPGSKYSYCNTAYMLLADIVCKVSGQDYESFMKERIFDPLGMHNSYIMDKRGEIFPGVAGSYRKSGDEYTEIFDNSTAYGQGGTYSNIEDMIKWMQNFLHPKVGSQKIFSKMYEPSVLNNGDPIDYGLGIRTANIRGQKALSHTGSSAGFRTWFGFFPEQDLGVIILANSPYIDRPAIVDLVLENEVANLAAKTEEEALPSESYTPSTDFERYEGTYLCKEYGIRWKIVNRDNQLILKTIKGNEFTIKPKAEHVFGFYGFDLHFKQDNKIIVEGSRVSGIQFEKTTP